jgi:hypothetical protein
MGPTSTDAAGTGPPPMPGPNSTGADGAAPPSAPSPGFPYPVYFPGAGAPPPAWPPRPRSTFVPGWGMYAIGAGLIAVGTYASSVPTWDKGLSAFFFMGAFALACVWLIVFIIAGSDTRLNWSRRTWLRWAGLPVAGFLCVALMTSGVPAQLRFALSQSALEHAVGRVQAGETPAAGWIGLEPVESVTQEAQGVIYFQVAGSGSCGYAYVPAGVPSWVVGGAPTSRINDHWWVWCEYPAPTD